MTGGKGSSRGFFLLGVCLAALVPCASAWARSWSLGSHLGIGYITSRVEGSGSSFAIAWPQSAFTYQPGIRIALGDSSHKHEVQLDSGFFWLDQAGSRYSLLNASTSYQRSFGSGTTTPIANVGLGLLSEGSAGQSSISGLIGAGIGLRHAVRERHGAVRGEARVDWLLRDATTGRPALTTIGLRLGFDLWL
jgi:hypothetical protein